MTNYVLLYTGAGGNPESEEQRTVVMAAWSDWYERMGAAIVDGGNPFGPSKSISDQGIKDGPYGSPPATGYTILAADSLDDAIAKVQSHPHIKYGGQVSVFETIQMS